MPPLPFPRTRARAIIASVQLFITAPFLVLVAFLSGCTTASFQIPAPFDQSALKSRAETTGEAGIRVSATLVNAEESRAIFGVDLIAKGVQPVWFEIENATDRNILFLPTGVDPEYFSPLEVSFRYHGDFNRASRRVIDNTIERLVLDYSIQPQTTESGFVFTNLDRGSKFLTVDLISDNWAGSFFLIVLPTDGAMANQEFTNLVRQAAAEGTIEVADESHLRALLEQAPGLTSGQDGNPGLPLNLVFIGDLDATGSALIRRSYRSSTLAPLYAFGRPQDAAATKQDRWIPSQPHQIRFWLTGMRFEGLPVWIGQASMPLGGRFGKKGDAGKLSPVDPNMDEVRNDIVQDMIYSQFVRRIGFVKGAGPTPASDPAPIADPGTSITDGLRAVLFFDPEPVSLEQVQFLEWESLASAPETP